MRSLALALLIVAPPAGAEIAPDIAGTLTICATPDLGLAQAVADLGGLGWLKLPPQDHARVGRALAPYELVFVFAYGMSGEWDALEAEERLADRATRMVDMLDPAIPGLATLVRSTGEVIQISARRDGEVMDQCILSLPGATPDEVAAAFATSFEDRSFPPVQYLSNRNFADGGTVTADWLGFAADAFPGPAPAPLLVLNPARTGD